MADSSRSWQGWTFGELRVLGLKDLGAWVFRNSGIRGGGFKVSGFRVEGLGFPPKHSK